MTGVGRPKKEEPKNNIVEVLTVQEAEKMVDEGAKLLTIVSKKIVNGVLIPKKYVLKVSG